MNLSQLLMVQEYHGKVFIMPEPFVQSWDDGFKNVKYSEQACTWDDFEELNNYIREHFEQDSMQIVLCADDMKTIISNINNGTIEIPTQFDKRELVKYTIAAFKNAISFLEKPHHKKLYNYIQFVID